MPLLYIFIWFSTVFHPSYVGVVEAEYLPKEKLVGISCKLFSDDLEKTMRSFSGKEIDILKGDKKINDEWLKRYFAAHLSLVIDGKPGQPVYLGYENDKETTLIYLELKNIEPPKQIGVTTDMLYDFKKAQLNIIHFIVEGKRQTYQLKYPNKKALFTID